MSLCPNSFITNMFFKVSVLVAVAVAVVARPETPYSPPAHPTPSYSPPSPSYNAPAHPSPSYHAPTYNDVPAQYNAQYTVNDEYSGNNYGHQEDRDGYKTQGTYYVQLPDSRRRLILPLMVESWHVAGVTYEATHIIHIYPSIKSLCPNVSVLVAVAVAVVARPETPYSPPAHPTPSLLASQSILQRARPPFSFLSCSYLRRRSAQYNAHYAVNDECSGENYGHQEDRDGYKTQGTYYVQLPDGRLQKVTYYVDGESGYVAEVTYEGEAQYPAYQPAPSPSYQPAPSPSYA
ncbi:uncharacterized protein LOC122262172 [Penaeus japonicus]|uniref:uncharacterized protein LOC122262172 n=1 Tax=Penaeus japonicus TaxID=27405 RepID=UPI001C70E0EB|nr:uncharacterized protein LOC122262172 [Penaeus japonicus]